MVGKYTVTEQIGKGATSVVYEGVNTKTKEKVAIKVIDSRHRRSLHLAANEIRVLQRLSHPNIIRIIETVETQNQSLIVMEKCKFSLSSVAKTGNLPYKTILRIFRDILVGVRYLHTNGIIHRDIKLGNVMISEENDLKIIDFGLSKDTLFSAPKTFCGTPDFISPEMMERMPYTKKTDIYSTGMLVYFLIFRCDYSRARIEAGKRSEQYRVLLELLEKMLEKEPSKRISAEEALNSSIFNGFYPRLVPLEGIKEFQIQTKLGRIEYKNEAVKMRTGTGGFVIKSGMGGVYELGRSQEEAYVPFSAVDTKRLKLVDFCYSILGLVKKRTPVVIILTDSGKFFKMLKDGVYVYIVEDSYILWQSGEVTAKNMKNKEKVAVSEGEREEIKVLIYEASQALARDSTGDRPITVDKRACKRGSLKHSTCPSLAGSLESSTLASLSPRTRGTPKGELLPVFIPEGTVLRVEPYLYCMILRTGECIVLNLQLEEVTKYVEGLPGQVHYINKNTDADILRKIILFESILHKSSTA
ncbi:hormonally upregulated Neu-associated kinase [Nematocida major]|uniref:hormonally upregulated Neu-associated kinase n=1 Tax=Nematocida major TaxID=1912982 RepID=UPI0020082C8C|nr:hormonally upregulated Neu-associated kinase [Nematocida major]KAH9385909.1 hormonally upregulated Neu-associated kinase [Nematocida major]